MCLIADTLDPALLVTAKSMTKGPCSPSMQSQMERNFTFYLSPPQLRFPDFFPGVYPSLCPPELSWASSGEEQRLRCRCVQPMLGSEKPHSKCPGSSHPHPHLGSQLCQESSPCAAHQHGVAAMATGMQGQAQPFIVHSPASKPGLDRAAQVSKKVGGPWLRTLPPTWSALTSARREEL